MLDLADTILEFASYVVFLADLYLELQYFFVLGAAHSGYFGEVFGNVLP